MPLVQVQLDIPNDVYKEILNGSLDLLGMVKNRQNKVRKHIQKAEIIKTNKEASAKNFDVIRSIKEHKAVMISVGITATLIGVGAYTYHGRKVHKKVAVEESFADFHKSLTEYLKASKNGKLNIEVVDNLLNALDGMENKQFKENMKWAIHSSQLTVLVSMIFAYTESLAKANSFNAKILKPQSDMKGKIESLKSYLKIQKQILQSAA